MRFILPCSPVLATASPTGSEWLHEVKFDGKASLRDIITDVDDHRLRYSEEFSDPLKMLAVAEKMGLEGVVSKRRYGTLPLGPALVLDKGEDYRLARGQQGSRRAIQQKPQRVGLGGSLQQELIGSPGFQPAHHSGYAPSCATFRNGE